MWESSPTLVTEASEFAEALNSLWTFASLATRSKAGLPMLAPSQARALHLVSKNGGITPSQLAAQMRMSRPLVSEVIRKLEDNNLIVRQRSKADGRSVVLSPTDRGTYVQQSFRLGMVDAVAEAFGAMPHGEVQKIMASMPALHSLHEHLSAIADREEVAAEERSHRGSRSAAKKETQA